MLLHPPGQLAEIWLWMSPNMIVLHAQSTSLVRHVFRLLETALKDNRGIPWVLLENVRPTLSSLSV